MNHRTYIGRKLAGLVWHPHFRDGQVEAQEKVQGIDSPKPLGCLGIELGLSSRPLVCFSPKESCVLG